MERIRESEPQTTNKTNEIICLLANKVGTLQIEEKQREEKPLGCHFKKTMESNKLPNQER